jgi:hypothetical protein
LELDLDQALSSETKLIIKFTENLNNVGKIQLTMNNPEREYYCSDYFSFTCENSDIVFDKAKQKSFSVYRTKIQKTEDHEDAAANCFSYKDCTDSIITIFR